MSPDQIVLALFAVIVAVMVVVERVSRP